MRSVRVLHANRKLVAVGMLGLLAWTSGCDGSGGGSSGPGEAPPPGQSGKEVSDAMKNAYGPKGVPKTTKTSPYHK